MQNSTHIQKILLYSALISVFLTYSKSPTEPVYAVLFIMSAYIFFVKIGYLFGDKPLYDKPLYMCYFRSSVIANILTYSWILIILTWVYGVSVGMLKGVELEYVFRNFFGLTLYILLPIFLIVKPKLEQLVYFLKISAVIQILYIFTYLQPLLSNEYLYIGEGSISSLRFAYSVGFIIFFPLVSISLGRYIFELKSDKNDLNKNSQSISSFFFHPFSIIVYTGLVILTTMSKGYILAFFILYLSLMIASFKRKVKKSWVIAMIAMIAFIGIVMYFYYDRILFSFSSAEVSNNIRAMQYNHIISEFSVFGKGLGSGLDSGFSRDTAGYGFELTYLNLIHKLGIFVIPLFFVYLVCVIVPLYNIFNQTFITESLLAFGAMFFLIVGAGNPILLAPLAILLHVTSIYIVINILKNKRI
jgi:hypothetical protein